MRIAVLSDIHGNLPALEAVVADVEKQSPDAIWCGGDLGWGGAWASECVALVRDAGWVTVKGNTDVWITGDPQTVESPEDRRRLAAIAEGHAISADDALWLVNLPLGHSGPGSLLLVHGTPVSPFQGPMPDDPAADFEVYGGQAGVVVYGHVHRCFTRRITDGTIVCNTGSVGMPADGPTAAYLVIDQSGPEVTLRHRRVEFDRAACIAKAREVGGPVGERFLEALEP